ncbi:GNAT family N-acetyltransferase [Campylobacter hyointestinalis]|uniref:GNAT family N-acetyltransferase n=1 Tax=Campylobacter hyointestinalis TaxID=198 RepID=UPI0011ACDB9E|nr:GNAT family protein [Campylobacter hyointestinalis]TWO19332.1 GNAT family N-acetyltransferase [Campylobacter hyointestinalis]
MIETNDLLIRKLEKEDFFKLYTIKNEKEIIFWENHFFSFPYARFEKIYNDYFMKEDVILQSIIEKHTNEVIGEVVAYLDWKNKSAEIGLTISKSFWGKGYGGMVILNVSSYLLTKMMFHRVEAKVLETNLASIKAFLKSGFQKEGIMKDARIHNGKYEDLILFSKII